MIRKVSPTGIITTIAGRDYYYQSGTNDVGSPMGIALDTAGSLYIAAPGTVLKLSPDGALSTIAGNGNNTGPSGDGGPATGATLPGTFGVAVDATGGVFISEGNLSGYFTVGAGYVRKIAPGGIITTIAGNGIGGYAGDGGSCNCHSLKNGPTILRGEMDRADKVSHDA